jgi:hypothetical protein
MAKEKKNSSKKTSELFHNIIKASVVGNPKPIKKRKIKKAG